MQKLNSRKLLVAFIASFGIFGADQLSNLSNTALYCLTAIAVVYMIAQAWVDSKAKPPSDTSEPPAVADRDTPIVPERANRTTENE